MIRLKFNDYRRLKALRGLAAMLAVSLALACGRQPSQEVSDEKIVGGTVAKDTDLARLSTVALSQPGLLEAGHSYCSATLIAANAVLTAGHCVTDEDGFIRGDITKTVVIFDKKVSASSTSIAVQGVAVHRQYDASVISSEDPIEHPMHDVAILFLQKSAPSTSKPVGLVSVDQAYSGKSGVIQLAGFGVTKTRAVNDTGTLRIVAANVIQDAGAGHVLQIKGPSLSANVAVPDEDGQLHAQRATGGACAGDSGGPAYVLSGASLLLAGATSYGEELPLANNVRGARYCYGLNGYVDLRFYRAAILKAVAAAPLKSGKFVKMRFDESGIQVSSH